MKKLLIMGILFLLLVPSARAEEQTLFPALDRSCLALPLVPVPDTLSPDPLLVRQCQVLASGYDAEDEASLFEAAGMQVLLQQGYDKPLTDPAHTCAFTIGYGTGDTPVCLIVIRGTRGAEWYANMDVAPSRNMDTVFAENFLYAASDVFLALDRLPAFPENTIYLVTGHSRGAACANLLALLLNKRFGPEHVLGLTFATPATLRSRELAAADNIWNFLNPEDAVPMLPLNSWGFCRAGHDILLPGDGGPAASLLDTLTALAPSSTMPSTGIVSPGLTTKISPFCTRSMSMVSSTPPRSTFAVLGASFMSDLRASVVFPLDLASSILPTVISVRIIAADSK